MFNNHDADGLRSAVWHSTRSLAERLKVGASLNIHGSLSIGGSNCTHGIEGLNCEDGGTTRPEVVHAEVMLIGYAAEQGYSLAGKTIYITHSPCMECAKLINVAGIKRVVYIHEYRLPHGVDYLRRVGIEVVACPTFLDPPNDNDCSQDASGN